MDPRQVSRRPELTPTNALVVLENKRRVRTPLPNEPLLRRMLGIRRGLTILAVIPHAPAPAPNTIVRFDQESEVWPSVRIERLDDVFNHELPS